MLQAFHVFLYFIRLQMSVAKKQLIAMAALFNAVAFNRSQKDSPLSAGFLEAFVKDLSFEFHRQMKAGSVTKGCEVTFKGMKQCV